MKNNPFFLLASIALLAFACTNPPAEQAPTAPAEPAATGKGVLSITSSADVTSAQYDQVVSNLTASGEWMKDWSYHAVGKMNPAGIYTFGVYPSLAALDHRRGIYKDLFPKLGITAAPTVYEIHNTILGTQPATKPAGAFIAAFTGTGMNSDNYAAVLAELETAGQGAPAGRIYHVCYKSDNGLEVIDVWESQEQFNAFGAVLMPILQAKGIQVVPAIYPLYNSVVVQ